MHIFRRLPVVISLWVLSRVVIVALGVQRVHPVPGWWADVSLYNWWANNMMHGSFPLNDQMWQYPPLAAPIFLIGYMINHSEIGFVLFALIADAALLALLMHKRRQDHSELWAPLWMWVAAPLIVGPILLGRFDIFPTLLAVAALVFAQRSEYFGAFAAVGALTKIWPILTLFGAPRATFARVAASCVLTFIGLSAILFAWWPHAFGFISGQKQRGLQIESVAALPYMWLLALHKNVHIALQFGAIELIASHTQFVCLAITVLAVLLYAGLALLRFRGRLDHLTPADITLAAVLISLVTSRVLSPQYSVWPLGILAVCAFAPPPRFKPIAILIGISCFAGQILYPGLYIAFELGQWGALLVQTIRIAALLGATVLMGLNVLQAPDQPSKATKPTTEKTRNPKSKPVQPTRGR